MAYIDYVDPETIPPEDQVDDDDHIIRIHGIHPRTMRLHFQLYREVMHGPSPLSRRQRELVATVVSALNECHY